MAIPVEIETEKGSADDDKTLIENACHCGHLDEAVPRQKTNKQGRTRSIETHDEKAM
jgi:hypothetical protein